MTDALLSDNQRKAEISHAFLAALSARDGYSMQRGPDPDVDSIDATIRSGAPHREAIVLELPTEESEWVVCTPERLIIRRCGWWISLAGQDPMDAGSRTIVIPSSQRIDGSGLAPLFAQIREVSA